MPRNALDYIGELTTTVGKGANYLTESMGMGSIFETQYEQVFAQFPSDLSSEQNAHYLKITAFTGGTTYSGAQLGYNPPNSPRFTGRLFIPGASPGEQTPLIYESQHNFTDIRLTNIINDSLIGISVSLTTKRMISPMVQILYRSTNLRQFDFAFLMSPKNPQEARQIELIVRMIRAYAAPSMNEMVLISPAEWEFKFYRGSEPNPHLPKIDRCVIHRVNVNYAPAGPWSAYKDGQPHATLLTFSATEVRLNDRKQIMENGF